VANLALHPAVQDALERREPVVALESALITHGFDHPANLKIAQRMEAAVLAEGACPAIIALIGGQPRVGLPKAELVHLAEQSASASSDRPRKLSLRDLPGAVAEGATGGTTVAATMHLARLAGIEVFATGGIGGVHRGRTQDVSADLTALGRIPLVVVCSGAKAILDLPRTREVLETQGVPVIGYKTPWFPAFYSPGSDLPVDVTVHGPDEIARLSAAQAELGLPAALLVCVPVPSSSALPIREAERAISRAIGDAEAEGVTGKDLTPFLLRRIVDLTGEAARRANEALLVNNARVAARIAVAMRDGERDA